MTPCHRFEGVEGAAPRTPRKYLFLLRLGFFLVVVAPGAILVVVVVVVV
jgi:hypothetical protein